MILEMKVPSPGESITEVEIATWLVKDGDYVEKDQAIAEVDSDKATLELPAEASGIITLKAEEGDAVAVGEVVCLIDTSAAKPEGDAPAKEEKKEEAPKKEEPKQESKSLLKNLKTNQIGKSFQYNSIKGQLPFLSFLFIMLLFYITNAHFAEKKVRSINKLTSQLKELRWDDF